MRIHSFLLCIRPSEARWGAHPARIPRRAAEGMASVRGQLRGPGPPRVHFSGWGGVCLGSMGVYASLAFYILPVIISTSQ